MKKHILIFLYLLFIFPSYSAHKPEFSTAGFFQIRNSGRQVYSMNPAWRFFKGAVPDGQAVDLDDSGWEAVSLPHGSEYIPTEASGCVNYQGETWYRKHFTPADSLKGKKLFLHFEAVMGKCKVFVNGQLLTEHFGGFLPVIAEVSDVLQWGKDNVIAVWADNSDDPSFPPGKAQDVLDFTYFGGIYRDCWLIAHNSVYITDPNYENETAGGGLFVAYDNISENSADILLKLHLRNDTDKNFSGSVEYELSAPDSSRTAAYTRKVSVKKDQASSFSDRIRIECPALWSPESPVLYNLTVRVTDKNGKTIDGYRRWIGIRSIEFKGKDGFWLNGKPYPSPLIGANRHQDYAIVGNAVSNHAHWRDARKLRNAGLKVIRNAHYPQDPAFMDACDELGLFVIVNTPGWQFWNKDSIFEQRVYSDIRNMVRRDRNHPSVWMWEPVLNETWYPDDFAKNTRDIVDAEYPFPYCYSGCDNSARGKEHFPVLFSHPANANEGEALKETLPDKTYFTREWGDNVDDWSSHNSPSRVNRSWGEEPMLVQARHYACPPYRYTSYDALYRTDRQHVGGCLWHSFDHQRGYHPDPFYGGLMDVFRQPKYSYYMFMAQRDPKIDSLLPAETGPMVYIAHEMTPFSSHDVTVYSNCDEVRLTVNQDGQTYTYKKIPSEQGMPSPIITFPDAYDFMTNKYYDKEVYLLAEGLIDGKVVATHKVAPARRPEKLLLWADWEGTELEANGSDFVTVIAAVADRFGRIKRLNNYFIRFSIEGEGRLLGGSDIMANPVPVRWGTAPVLVQSTTRPGKIRIVAEVLQKGSQMPVSGVLEIETVPSSVPLLYEEREASQIGKNTVENLPVQTENIDQSQEIERLRKELNTLKLKEVERQQAEFGESKK